MLTNEQRQGVINFLQDAITSPGYDLVRIDECLGSAAFCCALSAGLPISYPLLDAAAAHCDAIIQRCKARQSDEGLSAEAMETVRGNIEGYSAWKAKFTGSAIH